MSKLSSYEDALCALEAGVEVVKVSSAYEENEEAFIRFTDALAHNKTCTHLFVEMDEVAKGTNLLVEMDEVGMGGVEHVADAPYGNSTVRTLRLTHVGNHIDYYGAIAVGSALKHNTTLQTLELPWINIGPRGGESIGEALKQNTGLIHLK
mmetsp:Transcript_10932/g.12529  ORF Transcript_10932/g.12529 Transcript_10932/m.12529 type:complete len:151 (-) Transcript_10932:238-690(-)